jgi:glycosyltransferase XagB
MSAAVSLMQALLGAGTSAADAQRALEEALEVDIDPLHWCATHLSLSDAQIMRRAAEWAGMVYFDTVPRISEVVIEPDRLEALGHVRLYRVRLHDEDVAFAAPDFFGLLRLVQARDCGGGWSWSPFRPCAGSSCLRRARPCSMVLARHSPATGPMLPRNWS